MKTDTPNQHRKPTRMSIPTIDFTQFNDAEVLIYTAIAHPQFFVHLSQEIEREITEKEMLVNVCSGGGDAAALRNTQRAYRAWGTVMERLLKMAEAGSTNTAV
jgi:hypothetical protein